MSILKQCHNFIFREIVFLNMTKLYIWIYIYIYIYTKRDREKREREREREKETDRLLEDAIATLWKTMLILTSAV